MLQSCSDFERCLSEHRSFMKCDCPGAPDAGETGLRAPGCSGRWNCSAQETGNEISPQCQPDPGRKSPRTAWRHSHSSSARFHVHANPGHRIPGADSLGADRSIPWPSGETNDKAKSTCVVNTACTHYDTYGAYRHDAIVYLWRWHYQRNCDETTCELYNKCNHGT